MPWQVTHSHAASTYLHHGFNNVACLGVADVPGSDPGELEDIFERDPVPELQPPATARGRHRGSLNKKGRKPVERELEFSITIGRAHGDVDIGRIKERLQRWLDDNCIVGFYGAERGHIYTCKASFVAVVLSTPKT